MDSRETRGLVVDGNRVSSAMMRELPFVELERARVTLDSIADAVICTDDACNISYLNAVAERMTGWSLDEACGRALADVVRIVDRDTRERAANPLEMAVRNGMAFPLLANAVLVGRDGIESMIEDSTAPIHDAHGQVVGAVMVLRDVSNARAREQELARLAHHDPLTDLPNRMLLIDRLSQAISRARRHGSRVAVLFLDLDRFKRVNDSLGHAIGDKLLQEVGKRLAAAVRGSDTVSRYGGDEFVIVLSDLEQPAHAALQAEEMHARLSAPHFVAQRAMHAEVTIGISIFPDDGQDAGKLIECADFAMYQAKANRQPYRFFTSGEPSRGDLARRVP